MIIRPIIYDGELHYEEGKTGQAKSPLGLWNKSLRLKFQRRIFLPDVLVSAEVMWVMRNEERWKKRRWGLGSQGLDQSRGAVSLRSPVLAAGPTEGGWVPGVFMLRYRRLKLF